MTEKEKAKLGYLYNANYDKDLCNERRNSYNICKKYNDLGFDEGKALLKNLFNKIGANYFITPPLHVDYGYNISIGDNFYSNYNLIILDCNDVTIGNNVFIGPNCCIACAEHPLDYEMRNEGLEVAFPISIGNNVWIGANVTILAGVTIGDGAVIGAGSVVNKDVPSNVIAVGNPCKVLRKIEEKDKYKYPFYEE